MDQPLYYSHKRPDELIVDLEQAGFRVESAIPYDVGGERFLWVTVSNG